MVSAMRVGDFVLRLRLRCVAVSFCGGGSELVGWCVRVAARRFKVLFASFDAMLKLLRPAMVARGEEVEAFGVRCSSLLLRSAVVARGEEAVWYVGELECFSGGFRSLRPGVAACAGEMVWRWWIRSRWSIFGDRSWIKVERIMADVRSSF